MLADLLAEKYFERVDERMKKIPELRRLITAKEAGQYLSLSTDTIYRMASQKKLPYLRSETGFSLMSRPSTSGFQNTW